MSKCPNHSNGRHDDHGKQAQIGNKLYTYCTCGAVVNIDDVTIYENDDDDDD